MNFHRERVPSVADAKKPTAEQINMLAAAHGVRAPIKTRHQVTVPKRYYCTTCSVPLPPGKPNRECRGCREARERTYSSGSSE